MKTENDLNKKSNNPSDGSSHESLPTEGGSSLPQNPETGFWGRVKKDLQVAVQEGADLLKEGTSTFSDKTRRFAKKGTETVKAEAGRVARMGQLRYDHYRLNQKAQKKFSEIGGRIYELASKSNQELPLDEPTKVLISEIKEIEDHIEKIKQDIQTLSKKNRSDQF